MAVRCGVSELVSYAIGVLILVASVSIIASLGFPLLERSTGAAELDTARKNLEGINERIREVASLQPGTSSEFSLSIRQGSYLVWPAQDTVQYRIETDSSFVSRGSGETSYGSLYVNAEGEDPTRITLTLNYSSINLTGVNDTMFNGRYRLSIDRVESEDKPKVEVSPR